MFTVTLAGIKVPAKDQQANLKFSSTMSDGDFFKWLQSKGISERDCNALSGWYIYQYLYLILVVESRVD